MLALSVNVVALYAVQGGAGIVLILRTFYGSRDGEALAHAENGKT
jgi:hypothetical protein